MRYAHLKAFYHVAHHRSFSKAAAYLNKSQPALSDQVKQLERDHDVLLFHRAHRQISLTEKGKELFELARTLFEAEAVIVQYLSRSRQHLEGKLRLIADSSAHITDILRNFQTQHPKIQIELQAGNTAKVLDHLRQYQAEIGIFAAKGPHHDLMAKPLGAAPIVALSSPGFLQKAGVSAQDQGGLSFAQLQKLPLIFRESGSQTQIRVMQAAARHGVKLSSNLVVEGREALRDLAAEGLGIGFASAGEIATDTRLVQTMIQDTELEMQETIACLTARAELPIIRAFMEALDTFRSVKRAHQRID